MAQDNPELPEGTDKVIAGASGTRSSGAGSEAGGEEVIEADTTLVTETEVAAPRGDAERPVTGSGNPQSGLTDRLRSGNPQSGLTDRLRSGTDKLSQQAGEKARGLVAQGLERGAETLANVGKLVGDTAPGIEERLGPEYGDYARRAASAIESTANNLASKNPDELIEDTRNFVRNSPGIAIAGAAIVGFALARLLKTGLAKDDESDDEA